MSKSEKLEIKRAECSNCLGQRNCDILGDYDDRDSDEFMNWSTHWYLLKCRGCDHVFVQTIGTNSEDMDYHYEHDGSTGATYFETVNYWPALAKRKPPEWLGNIAIEGKDGERLNTYLAELYGALNSGLNTLAAIGLRTSFDVAAELLEIDPNKSFKNKLDDLVASGHIGKVDQARLSTLVDAGSASAHRGWKPTADELDTMVEVLEHFVNEAFILPLRKKILDRKLAALDSAVPKRKAGKKLAAI